MILTIGAILAVAVVAFGAYVRLAPIDAARWHIDPSSVASPGSSGWLMRADQGDAAGSVFTDTPEVVLAALNDIALATPRTKGIAGSVEEGRITYMTRSRLWGFPDFTTVQIVPGEGGASVAALARSRFGESDMGVNRARLEAWDAALRQRLPD